jgi:hypothetical protein
LASVLLHALVLLSLSLRPRGSIDFHCFRFDNLINQ